MDFRKILDQILQSFSLKYELDNHETIYAALVKSVVFKGTNLWILIFAILLASVGLNMNSTAVIIGAMLISPLMGPINGIGYSIAVYDFPLMRRSVKNFSFAVLVSLVSSTVYFTVSPLSTAHSELLARTSPTIYDVLIALFGGLAGIIAIASKNKGNVIPGVAIATALMPPLCTAGYGLATAQLNFFFGAIYLFTINTVFIALASVTVSQILRFPSHQELNSNSKKRVTSAVSLVTLLVLIPSIFFGYTLVKKERFSENAKKYIASLSTFEQNFLLKSDYDFEKQEINLVFGGFKFNEEQRVRIRKNAKIFNLNDVNIKIEQGLNFNRFDENIKQRYLLGLKVAQLESEINAKNHFIDSLNNQSKMGKVLLNELQILFPQVKSCSYQVGFVYGNEVKDELFTHILILDLDKNGLTKKERIKVEEWARTRLNQQKVELFYY